LIIVETEKDARSANDNPLGVASTSLSFLGLLVCVGSIWLVYHLQQERSEESRRMKSQKYTIESDRQTIEVADSILGGLSFVARAVVFGVGFLVGGTLSLVGFALGIAGLSRHPNGAAKTGVAMSFLGPILLTLFLYVASK
jgi:hypothetical protein